MQQSHVIEVAGRFAGAAVQSSGKFRFVAIDPRAEELDGSEWTSLSDVQRVVAHLLATGSLPATRSAATRSAAARPAAALVGLAP